ncbi:hypothetical protein CH063_15772 [Colletotrichum higginsianum]|uniref:Uncharacterized protein n=1 Tax=Colletotrichum higginsianum (strain IMI 349063) TaxID=759273 RepID=H1W4D7_COLHI|nr:hypothetical protein CH063_15772 [Colletotrichum higginsianum]
MADDAKCPNIAVCPGPVAPLPPSAAPLLKRLGTFRKGRAWPAESNFLSLPSMCSGPNYHTCLPCRSYKLRRAGRGRGSKVRDEPVRLAVRLRLRNLPSSPFATNCGISGLLLRPSDAVANEYRLLSPVFASFLPHLELPEPPLAQDLLAGNVK